MRNNPYLTSLMTRLFSKMLSKSILDSLKNRGYLPYYLCTKSSSLGMRGCTMKNPILTLTSDKA